MNAFARHLYKSLPCIQAIHFPLGIELLTLALKAQHYQLSYRKRCKQGLTVHTNVVTFSTECILYTRGIKLILG